MVNTIAIVSLSSGILGEPWIAWEREIGCRRLAAYGVKVKFMPHACCGLAAVRAHPEARAADLLAALADDEVDMILCAIGGDDTYRLLPHLFDGDALARAARQKIFLGFSDSTVNHFMLHKLGIKTFYGQAFMPDVCELAEEMLPYTRHYFEELLTTGAIAKVTPSPVWYEAREDFSEAAIGRCMPSHANSGFLRLQGPAVFSGEILGGCIDTIYDMFDSTRYADSPALCEKYALFPSAEDWRGRILLLETSEEKMPPARFRQALLALKERGVFDAVRGVLFGKPMDEVHADDYHRLLVEVVDRPALPIVCNLNVGHATPRCIIPFGVPAVVDTERQEIRFQPQDAAAR